MGPERDVRVGQAVAAAVIGVRTEAFQVVMHRETGMVAEAKAAVCRVAAVASVASVGVARKAGT